MATALHPLRNDSGPNNRLDVYPRPLMTDFDLKDNRYPTISSTAMSPANPLGIGPSDRPIWDASSKTSNALSSSRHPDLLLPSHPSRAGASDVARLNDAQDTQLYGNKAPTDGQRSHTQSHEPQRSTLHYALPPGTARRVVERYSLDETGQRPASRTSGETRPTLVEPYRDKGQKGSQVGPEDLPSSPPKTPSLLPAGIASPSYSPPVAPQHRVYAQQPTYITPPTTPVPINTVYSPRPSQQRPQEEVCVECTMRDQDMADVDVTSPGVWDRESDVLYEELKQKEAEDESKGLVTIDDPTRPRAKGGRLTEQNLKLWLSVNPQEPTARRQTLHKYIKAQRALIEAESALHARAMREAQQLDNKVRDAYSQLRRSAYDLGSSAATDDIAGVRIKAPLTSSMPLNKSHARSHSREVTLLENGLIVEHVDVRKEEKEARERKRKEERRARKSSRGSTMDVTSIISGQSASHPLTDSGIGLKPHSPHPHAGARPTSVLTVPNERVESQRAYSQASFSDVHSMTSMSPRRSRFFGFKNLSGAWRSQDSLAPSGVSGSMLDMHVALQKESSRQQYLHSSIDLNTPRRSQVWPAPELNASAQQDAQLEEKPKKRSKALAKIWRLVTQSAKEDANQNNKDRPQSLDRIEDDIPLAPPPPLSYLMNRGQAEHLLSSARHGSTPSLPFTTSPKIAMTSSGMSPSTGATSILPSPSSSRPSGLDLDIGDISAANKFEDKENIPKEDMFSRVQVHGTKNVYLKTSEPDIRRASRPSSPPPPMPSLASTASKSPPVLSRDKSLPPLPGEAESRTLSTPIDSRPRTVYTYDPQPFSLGTQDLQPPNAPFRSADVRRQSFGGTSSRPNLPFQTVPSPRVNGFDPRQSFGPSYDEFGFSHRSLGRFDEQTPSPKTPTSTKRKSKFGFASLLGKKSAPAHQEHLNSQPFPSHYSGQDGAEEAYSYTTPNPRYSQGLMTPRISVASRKALEERVMQDPDFVAYRYPSKDQRLDWLR